MVDRNCICRSCGRKVEFSREKLPCDVLHGWLIVSCLKGSESIERYSFYFPSCLHRWVDSQLPRVPEIFLKSLGKENSQSN